MTDFLPLDFTNETANLITSIAAATIACIALFVSIWQGYLTRQHNRLSVEPILHFTSGSLPHVENKSTFTYIISLANDGLGPAVINSININYKGELISAEKYRIHESSLIPLAADMATYQQVVRREINGKAIGIESIILPNNSIELLNYKFIEEDNIKRENIITNLYDIDIKVTYTSIYKNKFRTISLISKGKEYPPLIKENIDEVRKRYPKF